VVFDVKEGGVRKFPGNFDYYLEKKDTGISLEARPKIQVQKKKIDEAKERLKEEERRRKEEEKKRKAHNASLREEINKLEKKKEKLQLESYAKARALSDSRIYRDEDTARDYGRRLKEIERLISELDNEIKKLEEQII
jgi:ATPase subunit of ABC transporter with duplicated ATPase domains